MQKLPDCLTNLVNFHFVLQKISVCDKCPITLLKSQILTTDMFYEIYHWALNSFIWQGLTGRFNRLKPPSQYTSRWSIPANTGRLKILVADWSDSLVIMVGLVGLIGSVVVSSDLFSALDLLNPEHFSVGF